MDEWIILVKEFLRGTSLDIASFILIFGIFYFLINYIRVLFYENAIEKLEKEKQVEVDNNNARGGTTMDFIISEAKSIEEKYKDKLYHLNRKRRSILERLPFFKS